MSTTYASIVQYCTLSDLQNRLSATGVALRTDDSPPDLLGDVLDDASAEVDMHCQLTYDPAQLSNSRWIKHKTADIAAHLLCERRGDPVPVGIAAKHQRALEALEKVQMGTLKIGDVPQRRKSVPSVTNLRPALRPFPHAVVERSRGTEVVDKLPQRNIDPWDPMNILPDYVI
jgi:phage gp36-like protein